MPQGLEVQTGLGFQLVLTMSAWEHQLSHLQDQALLDLVEV